MARILESVQPASDAVFDALDVAAPALDAAFGPKGALASIEGYSSTRTHVARALLHRELVRLDDDVLGEWNVAKSPGPNCPVWLSNSVHSIRVLHTWGPAIVPPTGRNKARVSYFSNSLLESDPDALITSHKFLMLWERRGDGFDLRLVHTLGSARLNRNTPLDLDVYLERGVAFSDLKFEQRDEGLDFFDQEHEQEEEDEGDVENG